MTTRVTPAQRRYLEALISAEEHPIRVLARGTQWKVRSGLARAGLITFERGAGPRPAGDNITNAGLAAIGARCPDCDAPSAEHPHADWCRLTGQED